jgi:hypothetical protein
MNEVTAICPECSEIKKASYEAKQPASVGGSMFKPTQEPEVPVVKIESKTNGKEYHLSIEECRARALECAIKTEEQGNIKELAEKYFNFIYHGQ